jgi:hypothetical protein
MSAVVRAKYKVASKTYTKNGPNEEALCSIKLFPVTTGSKENADFFKWTPSGSMDLGTVNQAAADALELGAEYFIDFIKA